MSIQSDWSVRNNRNEQHAADGITHLRISVTVSSPTICIVANNGVANCAMWNNNKLYCTNVCIRNAITFGPIRPTTNGYKLRRCSLMPLASRGLRSNYGLMKHVNLIANLVTANVCVIGLFININAI